MTKFICPGRAGPVFRHDLKVEWKTLRPISVKRLEVLSHTYAVQLQENRPNCRRRRHQDDSAKSAII